MANILDHYLHYATANESPYKYHVWTGLSLLSHFIGRRVWTDMKVYQAYPHLYVALVGHPGIAKGAAMRVAKSIIKENFRNIVIAPASITKEALIKKMGEETTDCKRLFRYQDKPVSFAQISIFANEMVSLLNAGGNPIGMIDFLTDVWDQEIYDDVTKNKGSYTIVHPYISILGCFTTETAKSLVNNKIITGGMSRRTIFVCAERNDKAVPFPFYTDDQVASRNKVIVHGKALENVAGEFTWEQDAHDAFEKWYHENAKRSEKTNSDVLRHFLRTKPEYVIKISMLLAVAEIPPRLVHTLSTFQKALELVTQEEKGACYLFDNTGRNELATVAQDIERFIREHSPCELTRVKTKFWKETTNGDITEIDRIVEHLVRSHRIDMVDETTPRGVIRKLRHLGADAPE